MEHRKKFEKGEVIYPHKRPKKGKVVKLNQERTKNTLWTFDLSKNVIGKKLLGIKRK